MIGLLFTAVFVWILVPKFVDVFLQAKVPLSSATLAILEYSDPTSVYPWVIGAVLVWIAWTMGKLSDRMASIVGTFLPLVFLLFWGSMIVVLFAPLIDPCVGIACRLQ
jgi:hypothetical protein